MDAVTQEGKLLYKVVTKYKEFMACATKLINMNYYFKHFLMFVEKNKYFRMIKLHIVIYHISYKIVN